MKLGVMGGTFDPIHNAHLVAVDEVRKKLKLDEAWFIPAGQPWFKADRDISSAEHRVNMVRLAITGNPHFKLSTIEVERPGATYTVDTLEQLRRELGETTEIYLILGWDNLNSLPRWHEPGRLIELCRLVSVPRPGYPRPDLQALEATIPGLSQKVITMDQPQIDISSSEIRERVATGGSISLLVPPPVARYIRQHKLYLLKKSNDDK